MRSTQRNGNGVIAPAPPSLQRSAPGRSVARVEARLCRFIPNDEPQRREKLRRIIPAAGYCFSDTSPTCHRRFRVPTKVRGSASNASAAAHRSDCREPARIAIASVLAPTLAIPKTAVALPVIKALAAHKNRLAQPPAHKIPSSSPMARRPRTFIGEPLQSENLP
jgi:hypothetical protein